MANAVSAGQPTRNLAEMHSTAMQSQSNGQADHQSLSGVQNTEPEADEVDLEQRLSQEYVHELLLKAQESANE